MCSKCIKEWLCQYRRIGLIFLFALLGSFYFEEVRTMIYIPIIIFFSMFIIFWNFPEIMIFLHSKPVYIDDLFIDPTSIPRLNTINPRLYQKFQNVFLMSHNIVSSLFAAGLADFFLYRIQNRLTIYEALGVLGGILNIYNIFIVYFGKFLIYILIKRKQNYIRNTPLSPSNSRNTNNKTESNIHGVSSGLRLTEMV